MNVYRYTWGEIRMMLAELSLELAFWLTPKDHACHDAMARGLHSLVADLAANPGPSWSDIKRNRR